MKHDITARLRLLSQWPITPEGVTGMDAAKWCGEAASEIERLRSQPCPYVTGSVTQHCTLTPLTLADAEREAVELAIDSMNGVEDISASWSQRETEAVATLRGLLERCTKNGTAG